MKNDLIWTKTILTVYRHLERICGAIDKIVMQSALNSSNVLGQNYFYNNVLSISEKLIDLSERKVTLINLKLLIEETLGDISAEDASILIEKYFDGVKSKDISSRHQISMRTVFRKIEMAERAFKTRLSMKGYNDLKLAKMLKNESWINQVHNGILTKETGEFELSNAYLAKAVSM